MSDRELYTPGPAHGARVKKDGEKWTLILVREFAPVAGKSLASANRPGASARVGALYGRWQRGYGWNSEAHLNGSTQADRNTRDASRRPEVLEYSDTRWELEAFAGGTRLTLWHNIDRRFIAWGAAGWHIAFDGSAARRSAHWTNRRRGCHEVRRLATAERGVRQAVPY